MNTSVVIAVVVITLMVLIGAVLIMREQRSRRLRERFGPEYQRTLQETGNRTRAEAKLKKLEKRVESFELKPLDPAVRARFESAWAKIQARFVDDPRGALAEADQLLRDLMEARGYPVTDFEQRAADVSVNHALVVEHYRAGHEISLRQARGQANTEDLRQAMIHYRTLFAELANEPELSRVASAGS